MFFSMTGYGRVEKQLSNYSLVVDIKSLNGRYFDIIPRISESLCIHENKIISLVKKKCIRGKVFLNISLKSNNQSDNLYKLNNKNFSNYFSKVQQLQKALNRDGDYQPAIEHLLKVPEIFEPEDEVNVDENSKILFECIDKAINQLIAHRKIEGADIEKDILSKVKIINNDIKKIVRLSATTKAKELKRIKEKINLVIPELDLEENRLYQEIGIILEKKDINEEINRLNSHISLLKDFIAQSNDDIGKKINFLLQEIIREINTVGSKVENIKIKHLVVDVKDNVEKIREQAQNIL